MLHNYFSFKHDFKFWDYILEKELKCDIDFVWGVYKKYIWYFRDKLM